MLTGKASLAGTMSKLDMGSISQMLGINGASLVQTNLVKIVDANGQPVLQLYPDLLQGRRLDDGAAIAKALQGPSRGDTIVTTDGQSAYVMGSAMLDSGNTAGVVILMGAKVNQELLRQTGISDRTLLALTDTDIVASSDPRFVDTNWLMFGAGALVFLIAGFTVAGQVVRPVRQLTVTAGRLKDGDLDARSEVRCDDMFVQRTAIRQLAELGGEAVKPCLRTTVPDPSPTGEGGRKGSGPQRIR